MDLVLKEVVRLLGQAGTAVISDVFDNMGREPLSLANDLWPTRGNDTAFAGPAYTVNGVMQKGPTQGDREKLLAIDGMGQDMVAVFAGNDMHGVCSFGDLLASAMKCRGLAGVVVDGGVRDLAFLRDLDLPMMVRYRTPSQAIGRWKITSWQVPVKVRGALSDWVTIRPGDLIVADADGVVVVPLDLSGPVAAEAAAWATKDSRAREDILKGMKLIEALKKHGAL